MNAIYKLVSRLMYPLIRSMLFQQDPEKAHHFALSALRWIPDFCFSKPHYQGEPIRAMGLSFAHPVGLSAGFDSNGVYLDALSKLGFAFIEIGTVTPYPQEGNPKPRLFRIPKANALINRMGFYNNGVEALVRTVFTMKYQGVLGINIGKNKTTPLEKAADDYLFCLRKVYSIASYVTINVSSPNTPDLRQLQQQAYFSNLMQQLRHEQLHLAEQYGRYVPLVIKLSPDESDEALKQMADTLVSIGIDGIIATNTTVQHDAVDAFINGKEQGGLSGAPLMRRSTACLRILKSRCGDALTLIGVGGIDSAQSAREKLTAGASLLQVYTGLIYRGPKLIKELVEGL